MTVAVVAMMVIAGVGFFLISEDKDDFDRNLYLQGRLMVFGNANNDDQIDESDYQLIEDIITTGHWDRGKYPFADANTDGVVDEKDLLMVRDMIDRVENMTVHYVNADLEVCSVDYPLRNIVVISTAVFDPLKELGVQDRVFGRHGTSYPMDSIRHQYYIDLPTVSTASNNIDITLLSNVAENVNGGIDAVVTRDKWLLLYDDQLEAAGIPVVRMGFASDRTAIGAYLTLGYLMQAEERAKDIVGFIDDVYAHIDVIVNNKSTEQRPTVISVAGNGDAIMSNVYEDAQWGIRAGAVNGIKPSILGTAHGKFIQSGDVWHLSSTYDCDHIVYTWMGNYLSTTEDYRNQLNGMSPYWEQHRNYPEDTVILSINIPSSIGTAYLAEYFWPDDFNAGFAAGLHQDYLDMFHPDLGIDVSDHVFFVTYGDLIG